MTSIGDRTKSVDPAIHPCDVVLVGSGIMSATLGVLLRLLEPGTTICVFERLDRLAGESSDAWNNAGTGHAALCELNYTPRLADGSVDVRKAFDIAARYEQSKQFWAHLVSLGILPSPSTFVTPVPHVSFVRGEADVAFLRRRHEALADHPLFDGLEFTTDRERLRAFMPLVMEGRAPDEPVAATRSVLGTDVDFGALARSMFAWLREQPGVQVFMRHEVRDLRRAPNGGWWVDVDDLEAEAEHRYEAGFVFLGAGGGTLPLLDAADIPEGRGYGGFPVGGQWLRCDDPALVARHDAKVYGKAESGTPPMSVPHLDARVIDGRRALLFGPFAGFSTKFLKNGSWLDLPASIEPDNVVPMVKAGLDNLDLTRYLIEQVLLAPEERLAALRTFVPTARLEDWRIVVAGQRVQVIKRDDERGGVLEFGTEIVCSADGTLASLLGASPGASTAVTAMLDVLARCMGERFRSAAWRETLARIVPSAVDEEAASPARLRALRRDAHQRLALRLPDAG